MVRETTTDAESTIILWNGTNFQIQNTFFTQLPSALNATLISVACHTH